MVRTTLALAAVLALALPAVHADIIAQYNFNTSVNGTPDVMDLANTAPASQSTVSGLSLGSGLNLATDTVAGSGTSATNAVYIGVTSTNAAEFRFAGVAGTGMNNTNPDTAYAANLLLSFTVTPDSNFALDADSFSVNTRLNSNTTTTSSSPNRFALFVNGTQVDATKIHDRTADGTATRTQTFDLTSLPPLNNTSTFALVVFGSGGGSTSRFTVVDNLTLNGTLAPTEIPEPASLGLLALGALALLRRR